MRSGYVQKTCVRPFGSFLPGDVTEVPDGADVSALFWADPGSPEAAAANARRAEADAAPAGRTGPPAGNDPPGPSRPPQAVSAPPAVDPATPPGGATEEGA